jgi:ribosome-associated protein
MTNEETRGGKESAGRDELLGVSRESEVRRDPERVEAARELSIEAARMLKDDKCEDVLILDLRGHSSLTDFFVIASGTSDRQMRSAGLHVEEMARERGFVLHRSNIKEREATWLVLDFVDVVVHLFEPETRLFYDLEMLWGDVDRIEWRRPGDRDDDARTDDRRNRAGLRDDEVLPGGGGSA